MTGKNQEIDRTVEGRVLLFPGKVLFLKGTGKTCQGFTILNFNDNYSLIKNQN